MGKKTRHRKRLPKEDKDSAQQSDVGEKVNNAKTKGSLGAAEARLAAMEAPLGEPGEFCPGGTMAQTHAQPKDLEKSQLHQRCKAWIQTIYSKIGDANELAENFCRYGGFLTAEKRKLAERGDQQLRRSQVIASLYGTAMRSNNICKMNQLQRQSEDNERAFAVTRLEADVLNYHQDLFRSEALYTQLQELGSTMAVKVGEREFVTKPEFDLPFVSFESVLEEEKARMREEAGGAERIEPALPEQLPEAVVGENKHLCFVSKHFSATWMAMALSPAAAFSHKAP